MHTGFYIDYEELSELATGFYFLENEPQINGFHIYDFLHGYCEIFAQHLHDKYGYVTEKVLDANGELVHCYGTRTEKGKTIFADLRGETDNYQEFIREFEEELYGVYSERYPNEHNSKSEINLNQYENKEQMLKISEEITRKYNFWRKVT